MTWRPARGFRLGAMRERINIQRPMETLDVAGQTIRTWVDAFPNEPAQRMPVRGGEGLRGRQVEAGIDEIFVIHHRADVTPQMRVVHGSRTYGIVYVNPVEGGSRYLELSCKAVV
jgi:SPP1 family predicted phage head-tail adaptor